MRAAPTSTSFATGSTRSREASSASAATSPPAPSPAAPPAGDPVAVLRASAPRSLRPLRRGAARLPAARSGLRVLPPAAADAGRTRVLLRAAAPAATNGGTIEDLELASVTILDAGPFADLIELRHFEEAVTRLDTVRDVRVRRFGHQRAKVEIGMVADYAIGSELYRLGRPMQVELGLDGEVIVDFTDVPAAPEPEEPEVVARRAAEPAEGEPAAASEDEDSSAEEKS